jgi:hypothetical protein
MKQAGYIGLHCINAHVTVKSDGYCPVIGSTIEILQGTVADETGYTVTPTLYCTQLSGMYRDM